MKKALSLITAAALAAGTLGTLTASAHQADDGRFEYMRNNRCYFYFDVEGGDATTKLSDEFIYVNKSKIKGDGEVIYTPVYLLSHTQMVSDVIIHLCEDTCSIIMRNGYDPVEKYGSTPFSDHNEPGSQKTYKPLYGHKNGMSMAYQSSGLGFYKLAGEKTNDYPVGCFDMLVPKDIECGSYTITTSRPVFGVKITGLSFVCEYTDAAAAKQADDKSLHFGFNNTCPDIQINVSDNDLGDFNNDHSITESDGKYALKYYTYFENNYEPSASDMVIIDVNGDRVVDDNDAEIIMDYTLLYGGQENPEVSFEEYIIGLINE